MTHEELQAIKARHAAATEGEWIASSGVIAHISPVFGRVSIARAYIVENVTFIAHAHADIPALVAEVERLRAGVEKIASTLSDEDQHSQAIAALLREIVSP